MPVFRRIARIALLLAAAVALSAARAPVDEEALYPSALAAPGKITTDVESGAAMDALSLLNPSSRTEPASTIWERSREERAGGRNEVMAAVTRMLISSNDYCRRRSNFEASVCRIARAESVERGERAMARARAGAFVFTFREKDRVKLILKRVKKALYEVIEDDPRFSDSEKQLISSRFARIELAAESFSGDPASLGEGAGAAALRSRCLDRDGRLLVDNSFLLGDRIYLCPFHVAKAFATEAGRPEELMVLNMAHLLAHAIDPKALDEESPRAYGKAERCYASHFAGGDDPYGLMDAGAFRLGTERLCCRASGPSEDGVRACREGGKSCDLSDYMPELISDQWAYSALGRFILREQHEGTGSKAKKVPKFFLKQNRDFFSKNMYPYCDPDYDRREGRAELDPANLFVNPRRRMRLAEARKNPLVSKAISCPSKPAALEKEFGAVCWK